MISILVTKTSWNSGDPRMKVKGILCDAEFQPIYINDGHGIEVEGTVHLSERPELGQLIVLNNLGFMHDFRVIGQTMSNYRAIIEES